MSGSGVVQVTAADAVAVVMVFIMIGLARVLWEDGIQDDF